MKKPARGGQWSPGWQWASYGDRKQLVTHLCVGRGHCLPAPEPITGFRLIALGFTMKPSKCHCKPLHPHGVRGCLYRKSIITPVP